MPNRRPAALWVAALLFTSSVVAHVTLDGQSSAARPAAPRGAASAETAGALLGQYCVTCHNDRLKTANLSLEGADLSAAVV